MKRTPIIHLNHIDNSGPVCGVKGNVTTTNTFGHTCKRCTATLNKGRRMVW